MDPWIPSGSAALDFVMEFGTGNGQLGTRSGGLDIGPEASLVMNVDNDPGSLSRQRDTDPDAMKPPRGRGWY